MLLCTTGEYGSRNPSHHVWRLGRSADVAWKDWTLIIQYHDSHCMKLQLGIKRASGSIVTGGIAICIVLRGYVCIPSGEPVDCALLYDEPRTAASASERCNW